MWLVIYWIVCGLVLFGLTNPTVEVSYFKTTHITEFIASMIFGGLFIPVLAIAGLAYIVKVIITKEY